MTRREIKIDPALNVWAVQEKAEKIAARAIKKGLSGGYTVNIETRTEEGPTGPVEMRYLIIDGEPAQLNGYTFVALVEWIGDNAGTMAENVGIAVQNSIAEITRAGQQLGEWAAYQAGLSDEMLEIPAAQQKQFKEFTGFAAPTTTALNSMADEITSQIAQREAERQAARLAQEMPKAGSGVMPPSAALAAAGVATVGEDSADILGQAAESLKVIAAQRGSALQAFQRVQDSLTKKTQEIALQQLAEQQKQTGIAEQQLAATKAPQMMVLQ